MDLKLFLLLVTGAGGTVAGFAVFARLLHTSLHSICRFFRSPQKFRVNRGYYRMLGSMELSRLLSHILEDCSCYCWLSLHSNHIIYSATRTFWVRSSPRTIKKIIPPQTIINLLAILFAVSCWEKKKVFRVSGLPYLNNECLKFSPEIIFYGKWTLVFMGEWIKPLNGNESLNNCVITR